MIDDGTLMEKKQININLKWLNQCYPGCKTYFAASIMDNDTSSTSSSVTKRKSVRFALPEGHNI